MKTKILILMLILFFITSCSYQSSKDKQIVLLNETINQKKLEIEKLKKKNEINAKIERFRAMKSKIIEKKLKSDIEKLETQNFNDLQEKQTLILLKEKEINVKFYSQFPLEKTTGIKYAEPYQNFCEEASLLNGYYHLLGKEPTLKEYNRDLLKLKNIEDLILKGGYKHTSIQDTLKLLIAFQDNQKVYGEIIQNPTIEIIKENITKGNLIIVPLYGKGLSNPFFLSGGPIYHNLLIKGFKDDIFITNEVGISKGDGFLYKQNELMENIHNYDEKLYPENFQNGKKEILILYN